MRHHRPPIAAALAIGALIVAAAAAPASAAVTCHFDGDRVAITMTAPSDRGAVLRDAQSIKVESGTFDEVTCSGGAPTVTNTDEITVAGPGDFEVDLRGGPFAPGEDLSTSDLAHEIEMAVSMTSGTLRLTGEDTEPDAWRAGATGASHGINLNAADESPLAPVVAGIDADLTYTGVSQLVLQPQNGDNTAYFNGPATGEGFTGPVTTNIHHGGGYTDADVFFGGSGNDVMIDGMGSDTFNGGAGDDTLTNQGGGDDDTFTGGPGSDTVTYALVTQPMVVDLASSAPQDTGAGTDTLDGVENVTTGTAGDVVFGTSASNTIRTQAGDDVVVEGGGDDDLVAGPGTDTVSYLARAGTGSQGVTVDLLLQPLLDTAQGAAQPTGGGGTDRLSGFENVIGSPFADDLRGSEAANVLDPRQGADVVTARGGADHVAIRDDEADTASCGADADTVVADFEGLDTLDADCETRQFGPPPAPAGGGDGAGGGDTPPPSPGADTTPPALSALSITRRLPRGRRARLRLTLSEAARLRITIQRCKRFRRGRCRGYRRVARVTRSAPAGPTSLRLPRRPARVKLRPGRFRVSLVAIDAAGNASDAARLRFRVVRRR